MIRGIKTISFVLVFGIVSTFALAQNSAVVFNKTETVNLALTTSTAQYVGNYVYVKTSSGKHNFSYQGHYRNGVNPKKAVKLEWTQPLFGELMDFRCTITPAGIANCTAKK